MYLDYSDVILIYYLFVAKIIPACITYFADKYFNIKIRFKSLSILNASIQHINIKWAAYEIQIGEFGLKSKYLNSEYKRPLCVDLEDVKLNKIHNNNLERAKVMHAVDESNNVDNVMRQEAERKMPDFLHKFLRKYLPSTIMVLLKLIQIRIKNFSTTFLNHDKGPLATISLPNVELLFEGCVIKRKRTVFMALTLQHIKWKFLAYNKQNPTRKPPQACLAEIIFDLSLESHVIWFEEKLHYEKQHVSINNTQVTFNGGLFDIIEHFMLHTKRGTNSEVKSLEAACRREPLPTKDGGKLISRLAPEMLKISIEHTEVKSLNKHGSFHYHLLLQQTFLKLKPNERMLKGKIFNLRIYTPNHQVLNVKNLTIDAKVDEKSLIKSFITIDTVDFIYNHDDIYGWFLKIVTAGMKSNRKELILKAIATMNRNAIEFYHSEFVRSIFDKVVLSTNIELHKITVGLEFDDQISSINATKIKLTLKQIEGMRKNSYHDYTMDLLFKNRNWNVDFISEGSLCWYMDSKFPSLSNTGNDSKRTFVRGSALFLGDMFTRVGSHGEDFKLDVRVKSLQTEYSGKLTCFSIQALKCMKAFKELLDQMKVKNDGSEAVEGKAINLKELLQKVSVNVKAENISCFLINRHDICTFVSLSNFTSTDTFNYQLDTIEVSTVDLARNDYFCDLSELSTVYVSTKQIKVNIENTSLDDNSPQLCIDFTEKLDCSWNAHFIRHLLSLVRDFRRFKRNIEDALEIPKESKSFIPRSLPIGLDIKKLRNIRIKHADMNVDKLILLINELSGENLFFYNYFH